jgi:integrase
VPLKKKKFAAGEIAIFDEAVIYKRNDYWHFRMWLNGEGKYARKSLRTRSQATAEERGKEAYLEILSNLKAGKTYFSITTKEGVAKYIEERQKDVDTGIIVAGRLQTIKTHLQHWLDFIGKDTKLKELDRTDSEDYYRFRHNETDGRISRTTVLNEQSTINACISWLYKQGETPIDHFEFRKLPKIDRNNDEIRRATFTSDEYDQLVRAMRSYVKKSQKGVDEEEQLVRQIVRHWVLIAANSGLRVGEQRQLRWSDVDIVEHNNGTTM